MEDEKCIVDVFVYVCADFDGPDCFFVSVGFGKSPDDGVANGTGSG